jgi:hypothetical protein
MVFSGWSNMTFYICLGLCGINLSVHYDYIRFSFLFFTIGAHAFNLEHTIYNMHMNVAALVAKTVVLESFIKQKLPDDYKKIFTENILDPIKID